ncbi:MAG: hypothetical protein RJA10_1885 [Pseudomonadota bacterium]|jgi:hypothetical protein
MRPANPLGRLRGAWLRPAPLRQRAGLALLALLLVQAQGLGLWHRVAHGGPASPPAVVSAAMVSAPASLHERDAQHAHHAHHAHDGFGHDPDDNSGCRLFDQLAAADALLAPSALVAAAGPPPWAATAVSPSAAVRALRPYQARAPPRA